MRLFAAVDLPQPIHESLDLLIRKLKPAAPHLAWSCAGKLHITTKFIGEWPAERLGELKAAFAAIPRAGSLEIGIAGLGWFPNPHSPRVFWAAVHAPTSLAELAHATGEATAKLGVAPETRAFTPHLTLARIKQTGNLAPLRQAVAQLESVEFGSFEASSFFLYLSELRPSGSVYTKLAEFPLV